MKLQKKRFLKLTKVNVTAKATTPAAKTPLYFLFLALLSSSQSPSGTGKSLMVWIA